MSRQGEPVGAAGLHVATQVKYPHACCPSCQQTSQSVHSRYHRHPTDLSCRESAVHINLLIRHFYYRDPICPRRTFSEPVSELLSPRARRTRWLACAQGRVGVTCRGEAGARLLRRLGMPTSANTVLRLVFPVRRNCSELSAEARGRIMRQVAGSVAILRYPASQRGSAGHAVMEMVEMVERRHCQMARQWRGFRIAEAGRG